MYEEDAPYRNYIDQLERHRGDADDLLDKVNDGLGQLKLLSEQYNFVSTKSNSLHTACQHLLEEQTKLSELSQKVRLSCFKILSENFAHARRFQRLVPKKISTILNEICVAS